MSKGDETELESEWEKSRKQVVDLQRYLNFCKVDFLDRDAFKRFVDSFKRKGSVFICFFDSVNSTSSA